MESRLSGRIVWRADWSTVRLAIDAGSVGFGRASMQSCPNQLNRIPEPREQVLMGHEENKHSRWDDVHDWNLVEVLPVRHNTSRRQSGERQRKHIENCKEAADEFRPLQLELLYGSRDLQKSLAQRIVSLAYNAFQNAFQSRGS